MTYMEKKKLGIYVPESVARAWQDVTDDAGSGRGWMIASAALIAFLRMRNDERATLMGDIARIEAVNGDLSPLWDRPDFTIAEAPGRTQPAARDPQVPARKPATAPGTRKRRHQSA